MSRTTPVSMQSFMSPVAAQEEARELLEALPGSPRNLKDVSYSDFAKLNVEVQNRLIELIGISGNYHYSDRYLKCSIDLLVAIALHRNDPALFDRFADELMPVAPARRKHLGDVYKRIRAVSSKQENDAAAAIDAHFRSMLEKHGFMFGTLEQYPGGSSYVVIDPKTKFRYRPNMINPSLQERHAHLREGDEVVFRVQGVVARRLKGGGRLYIVVMTNLTQD